MTVVPACTPLDVGLAHEAGDLVPADVVAGPARRLPQLVGPVDRVVGLQIATRTGIITASRTARAESGRVLAA